MNINDFRALVEQRRSIRGYDESRDVPDEAVRAILDCARWAPSGGNGQPWEFIIIRAKEARYKIADCYLKQLEQKREMDLAVRGTAKMTGDGFRHAPVHLVVLGDPRVKESYPIRTKLEKAESHFITGLANATLLIHLAAAALGLASQYVSDANSPYMETMLKVLLRIPEPLRVYHLVPIGYAKSRVAAPPRRELEEISHYEQYDLNKFRDDQGMTKFITTRTLQGGYGRRGIGDEPKS
ncbi:MAG TPA: nitroreductase family protein [Candidatus Udaeobacter sp.]|jgi:nitroreductase|nr:nitroreductase family protein [Candidatus Udaeobacter sp.]